MTSEITHRLGAPHVHGPDGLLLPVHAAAHVAAHEHAQVRPDRYEYNLPRSSHSSFGGGGLDDSASAPSLPLPHPKASIPPPARRALSPLAVSSIFCAGSSGAGSLGGRAHAGTDGGEGAGGRASSNISLPGRVADSEFHPKQYGKRSSSWSKSVKETNKPDVTIPQRARDYRNSERDSSHLGSCRSALQLPMLRWTVPYYIFELERRKRKPAICDHYQPYHGCGYGYA